MSLSSIAADLVPPVIELLNHASIEIAAGRPRAIEALRDAFDPGTEVFVNFLPGGEWPTVLATATALKRAGFNPVPHVAASSLESQAALADFLKGCVAEAAVERVLLISGDRRPPRGPFASTTDLLATGILQKSGIRSVGVAGLPEGHPSVAKADLAAALKAKCDQAARQELELFIVTQFAFEARPILDWLAETRGQGIGAPVRIGIAGPATVATLLRFALACGVGDSVRALRARPNAVGQLLGVSGPEELIHDLAVGLAAMPDHGVSGLHFFPFGGVERTGQWLAETLARLYGEVAPSVG